MKSCGEEIQVRCNISTIVITDMKVKPGNQAVHIESIDISYVLTRYNDKSLKT